MARLIFWSLLLVSFSVHVAYCHFDYHKYISRHHKVASTTESISSSSSEISVSVATDASSKGVTSTEEIHLSDNSSADDKESEGNHGDRHHTTEPVLEHGSGYSEDQSNFVVRVVLIVGSVILFISILGCIVCCCRCCCAGTETPGIIIRDNPAPRIEVYPPQQLISPVQHQSVSVQHFPPNYSQEVQQQYPAQPYPPQPYPVQQYSPQYPGHTVPEYSPTAPNQSPPDLQFYNPPEAPPPYQDKSGYRH